MSLQPYYDDGAVTIFQGDAFEVLKELPAESVDCCVTSPPYFGLRNYGVAGQIGLESSPEEYVAKLVEVFREVRRVLKKLGTCWVNLGDSWAGSGNGSCDYRPEGASVSKHNNKYNGQKPGLSRGYKPKDLIGMPWMTAFALRADGWYLRQDLIWAKPNPMPESVKDRCTKSHEYVFLLSKSQKYYFDNEAIREKVGEHTRRSKSFRSSGSYTNNQSFDNSGIMPNGTHGDGEMSLIGRNKRDVWTIATHSYKEAHFATFPEALIEPMIQAGCPEGGIVLDPFIGSGTTAKVAVRLNRRCIGVELNEAYIDLVFKRIDNTQRVLI